MRLVCKLALASVLLLGLSSAASAGPVAVTYGFGPGGQATWNPITATGGVTGIGGGIMTVVYASGSTAIGGSIAEGPGQIQFLQVSFTQVFTLLGSSVPGMLVGGGLSGYRGGSGLFAGAGPTAIAQSALGASLPPVNLSGVASIAFQQLGAVTVVLSGLGSQIFASAIPANWTISAMVGQEIARATVPEPSSALLLGGALGLLGLVGAARRARR